MIIAYDAERIAVNAAGLGNYSRTLVADIANIVPSGTQLRLYSPRMGRDNLRAELEQRDNIRFVFPKGKGPHLFWRSHGMIRDLRRNGVELFHGPANFLPAGLGNIASVLTMHDIISIIHPEYCHIPDAIKRRKQTLISLRRADHVIAISECTKRDIINYTGVRANKISVVYQTVNSRFRKPVSLETLKEVRSRFALPNRFILTVGRMEIRKNLLFVVKSLPFLPNDIALVAVGKSTGYAKKVKRYVKQQGLESRVIFLHDVSNDDLAALYRMAELSVYPSRYEGFGLPVVESIQSGTPVIAAKGSCLEEAGGPDMIYVDPDNEKELAVAVAQLLRGAPEREGRLLRAQEYVRRYEGCDVAQQVLDIYKEVIKRKRETLQ